MGNANVACHRGLVVTKGGGFGLTPHGAHLILMRFICVKKRDQDPAMTKQPVNDPLHGVTLEQILNHLVEVYGWDKLGKRIEINCFNNDPSVKSSLTFLRKTPWARKKVEGLYLVTKRRENQRRT